MKLNRDYTPIGNNMKTLQDYASTYEDTVECHDQIQKEFFDGTNSFDYLKAHRDFIEESYRNGVIYGHGNRELQYMWKLIVDELPTDFKFLEIGVYKGQIISLIQLLADKQSKNASITAVTPLYDKEFADYNRFPWIKQLYKQFNVTMANTKIVDGYSSSPKILAEATSYGPYDVVFIDGDHSYKGAKFDIEKYDSALKVGGYMVIDDASNYKNMNGLGDIGFKGIIEVSNAVRDSIEKNPNYKEILAVTHNRIFKKLK